MAINHHLININQYFILRYYIQVFNEEIKLDMDDV